MSDDKPARKRRGARAVSPEVLARSREQGARRRIVQALYSWQVNPMDPVEIIADLRDDPEHARIDREYFRSVFMAITKRRDEYDALIDEVAERGAERVDPVERAILWLAIYELAEKLALPAAVVVSEALVNASKFGAEHSHRFVHSLLERLARRFRPHETADRGPLPELIVPEPPELPADLEVLRDPASSDDPRIRVRPSGSTPPLRPRRR